MSKKIKILVMDDEDIILDVANKMLKLMDYDVFCTKNGEETIDLFANDYNNNTPFDLVIMDLSIPGGLGAKETIGKLLEIDKDIKAIVSSGKPNDEVLINYDKYGFAGVIPKPFTFEELNLMIKKIVE